MLPKAPPSPPSSPTLDPAWLAARLRVAFAHYFDRQEPEKVFAELVADWFRVLAPFDQEDVDEAFIRWIATQTRRPHVPDIQRLAVKCRAARMASECPALPRPRLVPDPKPPREPRADPAIINDIAESFLARHCTNTRREGGTDAA